MHHLCLIIAFFQAQVEPPLSVALLDQLEAGESSYTLLDMGLIASGIESREQLDQAKADFDRFLRKLALSEKQGKLSKSKQIKVLQKNLGKALKKQNPAATLVDAMKDGQYSSLTASFILETAASTMALAEQAWSSDPKPADAYFAEPSGHRLKAILAAILVHAGANLAEEDPAKAVRFLKMSRLLDAQPIFETDRQSREWYNRAYKLYEAKALKQGALLTAASAARFANLTEFQALCFNFGILISGEQAIPLEEKLPLIQALLPHTGEHRQTLASSAQGLQFNQAVAHYQSREFTQAWSLTRDLEYPADPAALKKLQGAILEGLIEEKTSAGQDVTENLKTLKAIAPDRFDLLSTRLKQLAVKSQYEKGDYESALALAEKQLDTSQGRTNYLAVLQQLIDKMHQANQYETALNRLGNIPKQKVDAKAMADMKYNTYIAWLNHNETPGEQFSIYRRFFNDESLALKEKERQSMQEDWGNIYYLLIEKKIADREFHKAEALSKEAIQTLPDHEALLKQKALIETIMARIKN